MSRAMAEAGLLPAVRKAAADDIIVADGTSCRHQIRDLGGREAIHSVRCWSAHCHDDTTATCWTSGSPATRRCGGRSGSRRTSRSIPAATASSMHCATRNVAGWTPGPRHRAARSRCSSCSTSCRATCIAARRKPMPPMPRHAPSHAHALARGFDQHVGAGRAHVLLPAARAFGRLGRPGRCVTPVRMPCAMNSANHRTNTGAAIAT